MLSFTRTISGPTVYSSANVSTRLLRCSMEGGGVRGRLGCRSAFLEEGSDMGSPPEERM